MSEHSFPKDSFVIIDPAVARPDWVGVIYRVTKVNPVNVLLTREHGSGRPIRINPAHLLPAPETTPGTGSGSATADGTAAPPLPPPLYVGTVVAAKRPNTNLGDHLYVVIRETDKAVSIARLGGDDGRYWRGGLRTALRVIDPPRSGLAPPRRRPTAPPST